MNPRNLILVTGATGAQGGAVARHLLASGRYAVRCLTRNPESTKAAALARAGAELAAGDLGDRAGLEAAMAGCHGVFGVTNYWEHFDKEHEHGRNLVDAARAAGVRHMVLSTLPPAARISEGKLPVPHFDIKAEIEDYARSAGLPATFVHVAFYFENFIDYFPPQRQENGSYVFGFPQGETPLAAVAVDDVGGVVTAIFDRGEELLGQTVGIVGDDQPPADYAAALSRELGKTVLYAHVPHAMFAQLGFPGADDLANMFEFNRLYIPNRRSELEQSRSLYPGMRSFASWVQANREALVKIVA
jgi:uncharacterized protein YbjT (DUF2867 family)